ncbi:uncharacterized protein LOC125492843 [Beta vulgaris subsp. vulgaris]|uniref:uncharacterized protein LOC125492843 n=1 Tax=Beta vulgaris subsp. vulgaris TaxID=3555 RepID=UPI0025470679|nr:uncharacterized protein LOC125492843 [Beta vulgaris subsp. vulgaris]
MPELNLIMVLENYPDVPDIGFVCASLKHACKEDITEVPLEQHLFYNTTNAIKMMRRHARARNSSLNRMMREIAQSTRGLTDAMEKLAEAQATALNTQVTYVVGNVSLKTVVIYKAIDQKKPSSFDGKGDPTKMENWIREVDKIFATLQVPNEMRVDAAAYYLVEDADIWWTHNKFDLTTKVTVDEEGGELMEEKESLVGLSSRRTWLVSLRGSSCEQERAVKFEEKLDPDLHSRMGAGEYTIVKEVYTRACNVERIEEKRLAAKKLKSTPAGSTQAAEKGDTSGSTGYNKGRGGFNKNRNFRNRDSGGIYSSQQYSKENQNSTPSRNQPQGKIQRTDWIFYCKRCTENHPSKDCDGNAAPNHNGGTANATQGHKGDVRRNTGQVHVMNRTEANTKGNMVTGTFSIHSMCVYVLFDSSASHSFVSELLVKKLGLENSRTCDVDIYIPSGVIITWMDWLSKHKAKIYCEKQKVYVVGPSGVHEFYRGSSLKIISALTLKSYLRKGCPMYLCHVHDTSKEEPRVEDVRIANEFVHVSLDDIPGMPPRRDVEFSVDLMPGTGPISKPPYKMALAEMSR